MHLVRVQLKNGAQLKNVHCWSAKFRSGHRSLQNEPRSHAPVAINPVELEYSVELDPYQMVRELAQKLNVDYSKVFRHLAAAVMWKN